MENIILINNTKPKEAHHNQTLVSKWPLRVSFGLPRMRLYWVESGFKSKYGNSNTVNENSTINIENGEAKLGFANHVVYAILNPVWKQWVSIGFQLCDGPVGTHSLFQATIHAEPTNHAGELFNVGSLPL